MIKKISGQKIKTHLTKNDFNIMSLNLVAPRNDDVFF